MRREGECLRCGMCCGDEENGWCEHLEIIGKVGDPGSTACRIYEQLEEHGRHGCTTQPARPKEIYPWYRCGYRFVENAD